MKLLFGIFTAITLLFGTCKKTEVSHNAHPLDGVWHMDTYWAFSPNPMPTFGSNDVIWNFEVDQNKLTVVYNIITSQEYILPSGVHNLSVDGSILTIDGAKYQYTIDNGKVNIQHYFAPGEPVISDLPQCTLAR